MIAATAPLRPQTRTAAPDANAGDLEAALERDWRSLRFGPALEAAYERDTGAGRSVRHLVCSLFGTGSFAVLSGLDPTLLEANGGLLGSLRAIVIAAVLILAALQYRFRSSAGGWLRESVTTLNTLVLVAYAIFTARYYADAQALVKGSSLLLFFLYVGVAVRLQFRYMIAVNLAAWLGYSFFARGAGGGGGVTAILHNQLMLFAVVMLFSTVGNYLLEFNERRNYLLGCLNAMRHAALREDAESLRELTLRDALTGLYNRRHLDAEMARHGALGGRPGHPPVGLLQLDVDHFKRYNDRHGHQSGDRCLVEVATVIGALAETHGGLAARTGGEEFALLLPGHDPDRIAAVAEAVCEAVRALRLPHADSPLCAHVTVSVGAAACVPAPGPWAATLIAAADAALYAAKRRGRDRWVRFEAALAPPASPSVRVCTESLPPDVPAHADDLAAIEQLSTALGPGLRRLRFAPALEREYQERGADERRRQLAFLSVIGVVATLVYVALCRPVFPDIADLMLQRLAALSIGVLAFTALNLKVAFDWRIREGLFAAQVGSFVLVMIATESASRAPTVYCATLALVLLPMFSGLIAAQPLRFSLLPSVLVCVGCVTATAPELAERRADWLFTTSIVFSATLYSVIGGYLLELASRRAYVLDRLRRAQLAVLRHNTAHLQRLASVDPLTRLPNRRHFEAELERLASACMARREPLGLLILDVDHFKRFNDGYGHPAGDACLQRVGAALLQWARGGAANPVPERGPVAARIGGEEFGVLLPGSDASAALASAQRLRLLIGDLCIEHAHSPVGRYVSVSIGAASLLLHTASDARDLLAAADAALYRAKGMGRDRAAA